LVHWENSGQRSAISCQLSAFRCQRSAISYQLSAISDQLSSVSGQRSPQLFLGHLSGEGFVKREVSEATSSLLETETTTGQRISADKKNAGKPRHISKLAD